VWINWRGRVEGMPGSQASVPLVELTGGEPLLQEEIYPALRRSSVAAKYGRHDRDERRAIRRSIAAGKSSRLWIVKCPDSGEPDTFEMRNLDAPV